MAISASRALQQRGMITESIPLDYAKKYLFL